MQPFILFKDLQMLKLPPYGKLIKARSEIPIKLDFPVYIFCGKNGFDDAKYSLSIGLYCCVWPPNNAYEVYEWPVKDLRVVVADGGDVTPIQLKKFASHLLLCGALQVCILSNVLPIEIYNKRT